jgi:UDP-N-acetylmuramoylalanine--D-glutamate ligase
MRISVIGAGKSGIAAAKLAKSKGHSVFISEASSSEKNKALIEELKAIEISFEFGEHTDKILDTDLVITSPGVPPSFPYFIKAEEKNIPIISELEYAYQNLNGQKAIVAVTGTNGKTTIVNLINHIIQESGGEPLLCGNVGTPLSSYIGQESGKIIVIEASSYQLDRIKEFRPDVAVFCNITPDHLSYHGKFVDYFRAKWKITLNQKPSDSLILNEDDPLLARELRATDFNIGGEMPDRITDAKVSRFSLKSDETDIYATHDRIFLKQHKDSGEFMPISQIAIPGSHNVQNTLAAILACRYLEIPDEDIRDSITSFRGVEHRLEHVAKLDGADWYNDSKATNINAAWYGLSSFERPIIWLAGGEGDNNDYYSIAELVKKKVKNVISFGNDASEIFSTYSSMVSCDKTVDLEEAVQLANSMAEDGDIILLSPACKSFDQYTNYEERGRHFKELVGELL